MLKQLEKMQNEQLEEIGYCNYYTEPSNYKSDVRDYTVMDCRSKNKCLSKIADEYNQQDGQKNIKLQR